MNCKVLIDSPRPVPATFHPTVSTRGHRALPASFLQRVSSKVYGRPRAPGKPRSPRPSTPPRGRGSLPPLGCAPGRRVHPPPGRRAPRGDRPRPALPALLGRPHGGKLNFTLTSELPLNVLQLSLDPGNITLEAEHYPDVDAERFAKNKPLLWFWHHVRPLPIGLNHWLGIRFRCMLGRHLFAKMGKGVRIAHGVELTYGYNLTIEDGVIVRQRALLDDRAAIRLGQEAVIGTTPASTPTPTTQPTTTRSSSPPPKSARAPASAHTPSSWPVLKCRRAPSSAPTAPPRNRDRPKPNRPVPNP
jgi:hypothetical protein